MCRLYLKVIAAAYSWPTSGSTGPWIALLASQSLPSSTEILVCNVIRPFFFVPPVWQWHTVQWFSGVCILSARSCWKNTCCLESWENYSDLETLLRALKVYCRVFPPPIHACHADLRNGAVIPCQNELELLERITDHSYHCSIRLLEISKISENAFSLTSNMVCVSLCSYFYFPLQCSVSPHTHVSICLACARHFSNVSSETSLVFSPLFLYEGGSSSGCKPPSSTLCQPAALGFSPAEPTMSSQHSHPSFSNIHSMADQQQVPETRSLKLNDIIWPVCKASFTKLLCCIKMFVTCPSSYFVLELHLNN